MPAENPFDTYPRGGRELLGPLKWGNGTARLGYGLDLQRRTGQTRCAYCGTDLTSNFDRWLAISVDHVVPRSDAIRLGIPVAMYEDLINLVLACAACNGFGNRYTSKTDSPTGWTLEGFCELRDRCFAERYELVKVRRQQEQSEFQRSPWTTKESFQSYKPELASNGAPEMESDLVPIDLLAGVQTLRTIRIRNIRAVGLVGATPEGGWTNELRPEDSAHTLIVVETDAGVSGIGSVFTNAGLVRAALQVLEPLYMEENALEPERVSEKLHQNTFWMGRGGSITHTISGIDIALWDILGKASGQPVGRLLGGRYRDRVKPYASLLMDEPAAMTEHLLAIKEQGFRAFKIGWGPFGRVSNAMDEAIVATAREAIGPDTMLMVDPGGSDAFWPHGYKWALRTAEMLAGYDVAWFEEALRPDALEDFVALRRNAPLPITGGETLTRRQAFQPFLQAGAFDIVQPDVTKVGGISEERRIAWMAADNGIRMIPHGWNTAIGLAADLQLASAFPETDLVEYISGSAYVDEITVGGWRLDEDGMLPIPDGPGLGVEIDWDAVGRYSREG